MQNKKHLITSFGQLADDFFYNLLLMKGSDIGNNTIPFLHAHILELSVKAYCLKNEINYSDSGGHKIIDIYKRIATKSPELTLLLPASSDFIDYQSIWFPSNKPVSNVELLPQGSDKLDFLELAYILDNVMDLKYGFRKDFVQVSSISLSYPEVNKKFLDLFNFCRDGYKTVESNNTIKSKIFKLFGQTNETDSKIKNLINV